MLSKFSLCFVLRDNTTFLGLFLESLCCIVELFSMFDFICPMTPIQLIFLIGSRWVA